MPVPTKNVHLTVSSLSSAFQSFVHLQRVYALALLTLNAQCQTILIRGWFFPFSIRYLASEFHCWIAFHALLL